MSFRLSFKTIFRERVTLKESETIRKVLISLNKDLKCTLFYIYCLE